jgi:hypothetical protein
MEGLGSASCASRWTDAIDGVVHGNDRWGYLAAAAGGFWIQRGRIGRRQMGHLKAWRQQPRRSRRSRDLARSHDPFVLARHVGGQCHGHPLSRHCPPVRELRCGQVSPTPFVRSATTDRYYRSIELFANQRDYLVWDPDSKIIQDLATIRGHQHRPRRLAGKAGAARTGRY